MTDRTRASTPPAGAAVSAVPDRSHRERSQRIHRLLGTADLNLLGETTTFVLLITPDPIVAERSPQPVRVLDSEPAHEVTPAGSASNHKHTSHAFYCEDCFN